MLLFQNIHKGLEECRRTENALLIDVRNRDEYAEGHVPGSINLSLRQLREIDEIAAGCDQPLFLYLETQKPQALP